jgi:perosamine synthetase
VLVRLVCVATVADTHWAFLKGQSAYLRSRGYDVHLVASPGSLLEQVAERDGVTAHAIPMTRVVSPGRDLVSIFQLWKLFRRLRPDVVQVSTPKAALLGSIAAVLAGVPSRVFLVRGSVASSIRGWGPIFNRWAERLVVRLADEVVVVSNSLLNFLMIQEIVRPPKGLVIAKGMSNGVDAERFRPAETQSGRRIAKSDALVVGFVGRLNREKGVEELAAAWQVIRQEVPEAKLLLVGAWEKEDPVKFSIRRQLEEDDRVECIGVVSDPRPYYARMTVLAFPSHREGFPNVPMEAAAMGIPSVATRAIGSVDAVIDNVTGRLVDVGDAATLAQVVIHYLRYPELARRHGQSARDRVTRDFAPIDRWRFMDNVYRTVIERGRASRGWYRGGGKRLFDVCMAVALLICLSPLIVVVAVLVRLQLGTPILFRQQRPGRFGHPFELLKFRTMTAVRAADGKLLPDAERLTSFGRWLRSTSLDELPELWNVLRGDMSLVGPRPLLMEYLAQYTPEQNRRHEVRPGVTGLAQIRGRNSISWDEKFRHDIDYVDRHSLLVDIGIMIGTITKVLSRDGVTGAGQATVERFARPRSVVVVGSGGHGKSVIATLQAAGVEVTEVRDDDPSRWGEKVNGIPITGGAHSLQKQMNHQAIIAVGDEACRRRLAEEMITSWISAIHPSALVDPTASIGSGTFVAAGAILQADCRIGDHVIVNTGARIDHDVVVGDFSSIGPGATVAGGVVIGEMCMLGAGCTVLPGVRIGDRVKVGAGATVTKDIKPGLTVIGCPARPRPIAATVKDQQTAAGWPVYDDEQLEAVSAVLRSGKVNYWTGSEGKTFEQEYATSLGVRHAVAVANGTVALELALIAAGIGPGDEVVVPSRTFVATASAVLIRGATPVFADIDPLSQNLTDETVEAVLSDRTKAIIVVHVGGWPCEMAPIRDLAASRKLFVIEDCAQAHGALYRGQPVGSLGDIAAFSFCQDKIITTGGEGGLIATNSTELWERAWAYKDHGKNRKQMLASSSPGSFRFLHDTPGTNWRMTEMQAALGRIQLRRLSGWVSQRRRNAASLMEGLDGVAGINFPRPPSHSIHSYYRLYGSLETACLLSEWSRDRIIERLRQSNVDVGCGSSGEIYREKALAGVWNGKRLPQAQLAHESSLAFSVHPTLNSEDLQTTAHTVRATLHQAVEKRLWDERSAA